MIKMNLTKLLLGLSSAGHIYHEWKNSICETGGIVTYTENITGQGHVESHMSEKELMWHKLKQPALHYTLLQLCEMERRTTLMNNLPVDCASVVVSRKEYWEDYCQLMSRARYINMPVDYNTQRRTHTIMGVEIIWIN